MSYEFNPKVSDHITTMHIWGVAGVDRVYVALSGAASQVCMVLSVWDGGHDSAIAYTKDLPKTAIRYTVSPHGGVTIRSDFTADKMHITVTTIALQCEHAFPRHATPDADLVKEVDALKAENEKLRVNLVNAWAKVGRMSRIDYLSPQTDAPLPTLHQRMTSAEQDIEQLGELVNNMRNTLRTI